MQSGGKCVRCGAVLVPGARFCSRCGGFLPEQQPSAGPPSATRSPFPALRPMTSPPLPPPGPPAGASTGATATAPGFPVTDQTPQGLLYLAIGFLLGWIPLIGVIGGILSLIGLVYVYNGRRDLGPEHHRAVVRGLVLIVAGIVGGLAASAIAAWLVYESVAVSFGGGAMSSGPSVGGGVIGLAALASVSAVLGSLGRVLLVWVPADRRTRIVLWVASALLVPLSVAAAVLPIWVLSTAVSTSSAATYDASALGLELLGVVPAVLFAWAYLAVRARLRGEGLQPNVGRAPRYGF